MNTPNRYGPPSVVAATKKYLEFFRAFLAQEKPFAEDPLNPGQRMSKDGAREHLRYLILVSIMRKGGLWPQGHRYQVELRSVMTGERPRLEMVTSGLCPLNHRGLPCRKFADDYQLHLRRDAQRLRDIAARVRVYQLETPALSRRFAHLLATRED